MRFASSGIPSSFNITNVCSSTRVEFFHNAWRRYNRKWLEEGYMMKQVQSNEEYRETTKDGRVMVEFYANWCPDCKRIEPYFDEWEAKYEDGFSIVRANRDELPELGEELEILGIPTFIAYENGKEVARLYSRDAKSKEQVESFLDEAYRG
jgi:thiol-disulfide isomerase/thioredoxin